MSGAQSDQQIHQNRGVQSNLNPATSSIDYAALDINDEDRLAIERLSADIRVPRSGRGIRLQTGAEIERLYRELKHHTDFDLRILKLKDYGLSDHLDQWTMDRILTRLMDATSIEVLYIQNFPDGMQDEQLLHLTKVLKKGHIWALNVGELSRVTRRGWDKFAADLKDTNVTHMYASENTLLTKRLKRLMLDALRANRKKDKRHYNKENSEIINRVTHMWFNPKASDKYQRQFADPSKFCDGEEACLLAANPEEDNAERVDNWVQCENEECKKWRRIPRQASEVVISELPTPWHCTFNSWDPMHNICACEEEKEMGKNGGGGGGLKSEKQRMKKAKRRAKNEEERKQKAAEKKAKKEAEKKQKAAEKMAEREQKAAKKKATQKEKKRLKTEKEAAMKELRKAEKRPWKELKTLKGGGDPVPKDASVFNDMKPANVSSSTKKRKAYDGSERALSTKTPKRRKKKPEEPDFGAFDPSSINVVRMSQRQQMAYMLETSEREHITASDGVELIGQRLRIFSPKRNDWVSIKICKYAPERKLHTVQFGGKYVDVNLNAVRVRKEPEDSLSYLF
jgi:hypothetical protein